jgi:hypothetical protein
MKFVLLLSVYTSYQPAPFVYVLDHDISGEDCVAAMEELFENDMLFENGIPSCELDVAELDQ